MTSSPPPGAKIAPSTARNRDPILHVLRPRLPKSSAVLEIASGAGEHAAYFATAMPSLRWQPSDADPESLTSIEAWRLHADRPNLLPAMRLDVSGQWPPVTVEAVVNINMIHISPWGATEGLMRGAARVLAKGGLLFLYGPFIETDVETATSNLEFDHSLRARNPHWGLRRLDEVITLAAQHDLAFAERIEMPANNLSVIFKKV